jgi:uncharacterized membrane protein
VNDQEPVTGGLEPLHSDRWLGAVCYLSLFVFVPILMRQEKSEFLVRHCQRGFLIFFAEVALLILVLALEETLGRIPILGSLVMIIVILAYFVLFLALSVIGFIKALAGEDNRLPVMDEYATRVPIS